MSNKCSVIDCKSRKLSSKRVDDTPKSAVTFFAFPSSPTTKQKWLENIGRPYFKTTKSSVICSKHFDGRSLEHMKTEVVLAQGAIPVDLHSKKLSPRRLMFNSPRVSTGNLSLNNSVRVTRSSSPFKLEKSSANVSATEISFRPMFSSSIPSKDTLPLNNNVGAIAGFRRVTRSTTICLDRNQSLIAGKTDLSRRLISQSSKLSEENSSLNNKKRVSPSSGIFLVPEIGPKRRRIREKDAVALPEPAALPKPVALSKPAALPKPVTLPKSSKPSEQNLSLNKNASGTEISSQLTPKVRKPSSQNVSLNNNTGDTTAIFRRVTRSATICSDRNPLPMIARNTEISRQLTPKPPKPSAKNLSSNTKASGTKISRPPTPKPAERTASLNNKQSEYPKTIKPVPEIGLKRRRNISIVVSNYKRGGIKNVAVAESKTSVNRVSKKIPNNQRTIESFFTNPSWSSIPNNNSAVPDIEDGIFGWAMMGSHAIPFIVRNSEKYCALRMVENYTALAEYQRGNPKMGSCQTNMECYKPTEAQYMLLNEINEEHCDSKFGKRKFNSQDKLVRLSEAIKYFSFLEVCYHAHSQIVTLPEGLGFRFGFGFISVNNKAYIPYIVLNGQKLIPLMYLQCDGEILDFLNGKARKLCGDDAFVLKLCCKYDGMSQPNDWIEIINLAVIQAMSPPKTTFEDRWPTEQDDVYRLRVVQMKKGLRLEYIKTII